MPTTKGLVSASAITTLALLGTLSMNSPGGCCVGSFSFIGFFFIALFFILVIFLAIIFLVTITVHILNGPLGHGLGLWFGWIFDILSLFYLFENLIKITLLCFGNLIILEVDQTPVENLDQFNRKIGTYKERDTILFLIKRGEATLYLTVKVWK